MFVKDYMTRHPIMTEATMRVIDAQKLMVENNIRHVPVVGSGKRLIGLVTRQRLALPPETLASLDVWEIARHLSDMTVSKVMITGKDLHTIGPEATLEEAADVMIEHKIGGLPVVEEGIVVGIITETDLLIQLQELLGAQDHGWRVVMRVPDRLGEYRRLIRAISDRGWGVMAMGSVRTPKRTDAWDIILKVRHCTQGELLLALKEIEEQEVIDIRETGLPKA
ncbi:MAG: CBS domain-containing protein [Chloroflexi bacterium]|nr:CBS domain-containing protein [Chloroflexota bacterium]